MEQLEALYDSTPKATGFIERKIDLPTYTVNLYGPPQSGKTWLALDHLSRIPKKKHLYIDMQDLRLERMSLQKKLQDFIRKEAIETVVLDHYDGTIAPPEAKQCIIVTQKPLRDNPFLPLLYCPTLDFEEYLAFEKRLVSLEHSFSLYLRHGSLPTMTDVHESQTTLKMHRLIRQIFPNPTDLHLFRHLSRHQGKAVSAHQIYTSLKKSLPISKDRLYRTLQSWQERGIIGWIPKHEHPRATRKLIFFDFALPASLYFEKSLMGQLQTIAASSLLRVYPDIAYTDHLDFFDDKTKQAWLIVPFANQENIAKKAGPLMLEMDRHQIRKVTILTIANTFELTIETMTVQAVPLYGWALSDITE